MSADGQEILPPVTREAPPHRRSARPWMVVLAIAVVSVAAAAAAEWIARGVVTGGVRTFVTAQMQASPGEEIDVQVEGLVLPQLISGTFEEITVSAPGLPLGPITGDVTVTALGVPIRGDAAAAGGTAIVALDQAELRRMLAEIDGFPADTVGLAAPSVTMSTDLSLFGTPIPVGASLTPSAAGGTLTLTPAGFRVGGARLSADDLRQQFGEIADAVLREWSICVADHVPAALTLTGARVDPTGRLVATFGLDGAVVVDRTLLQPGSCR